MIAVAPASPYDYYFLKFNPTTKSYSKLNLATLIGSEIISSPDKGPVVSDTCDMISINKKIFYADASGDFKAIGNDLAAFDWIALDNNFVYAYSKGFIWKYNSATKKYDNIYAFPQELDHSFQQIFSSGNKFIMYAVEPTTNYNTYLFSAFREDNNKVTYIGNDYVFDTPQRVQIKVSSDVTKVLLYALNPGSVIKDCFQLWDINYTPLAQYAIKKY